SDVCSSDLPGRRHPEDPAQPCRGHRGGSRGRARDLRTAGPRHRGAVMTATAAERLNQARAWLRQDRDAETRDELAGIITRAANGEAAAIADLDDRFGSRLAFGTAGLRGAIAAGSNRMNRVLVAQAAAGFAGYLLQGSEERRVGGGGIAAAGREQSGNR